MTNIRNRSIRRNRVREQFLAAVQHWEATRPHFTPSELSCARPLAHRAINNRIEFHLASRYPEIFEGWLRAMEQDGSGKTKNPKWGISLLSLASALAMQTKRGDYIDVCAMNTKQAWQMERNIRFLVFLTYRGCQKRGEL